MRFHLLPKSNIFYEFLGKLAQKAEESSALFCTLLEEWNSAHPGIEKLRLLEHECDGIVHHLMMKLNQTFVTPIDREDIHHLAKAIDDLVDSLHTLSERMVLFKLENVSLGLKEMAGVLHEAIQQVSWIVHAIAHLKKAPEIIQSCIQIHTLENQGDRLYEKVLGELFQDPYEPIEIIKWKDLYTFLEQAIDKCEDIADIVWGIVVKYG